MIKDKKEYNRQQMRKDRGIKLVSFEMTKENYATLKQFADRTGISQKRIINKAIETYILTKINEEADI